MYVSLPEIQQVDHRGRVYTAYSFYIGSLFHSSWRYSELERLHQALLKLFPTKEFPAFPPKKWFSMATAELQQRHASLETYLQTLFYDETIAQNQFLQETFIRQQVASSSDCVNGPCRTLVHFMDGSTVELELFSTSSASTTLRKACERCGVDSQFSNYFAVYLATESRDQDGEPIFSLVRKLEDFEAPFVSVRTLRRSGAKAVILLRKQFWDVSYDRLLLTTQRDEIRWLLFIEAAHAARAGYIDDAQVRTYLASFRARCALSTRPQDPDHETIKNHNQLSPNIKPTNGNGNGKNGTGNGNGNGNAHNSVFTDSLAFDSSLRGLTLRFLALCRKSRTWNSLRFRNCRVRIPLSGANEQCERSADVRVGPRDLVLIVRDDDSNSTIKQQLAAIPVTTARSGEFEIAFRISRMRCWRVQPTKEGNASPSGMRRNYSFAFEYLFGEDSLSWITVLSDDALFLKSCLQEIVDEVQRRQVMGQDPYAAIAESKNAANTEDDQLAQSAHSQSMASLESDLAPNNRQSLPAVSTDSLRELQTNTSDRTSNSKSQSDSAVSISISASTSSSSVSMPDSVSSSNNASAQVNGHSNGNGNSNTSHAAESVSLQKNGNSNGKGNGHRETESETDEFDAVTRVHRHAKCVTISERSLADAESSISVNELATRRRTASASSSRNPLFRTLSFMSTSSNRASRVSDVFEAFGDDEL